MKTAIVILCAGKGTRMKSSVPKVLNEIAGRSLVENLLDNVSDVSEDITFIVSEEFAESFVREDFNFVLQKERKGTGHAVSQAEEILKDFSGKILILYGDVPFVKKDTILKLIEDKKEISLLLFEAENPTGYGRVIVEGDEALAIVEEKDANTEQKKISLCNSGILAADSNLLWDLLRKVDNKNNSAEYYLTDIVAIAKRENKQVGYYVTKQDEVMGINTKKHLADAERIKQDELRDGFLQDGVTMLDSKTVYFSYDTKIAAGVVIEPNVFFGKNVVIEEGVRIKAFSHLEDVTVGRNTSIGPFARIRGGTEIKEDCKIGNFVEVKNSKLESGVKASHLSYLGDSEIGKETNIGAGAITCNYDGKKKHKTVISENVFVGSNSSLIAPINIAKNVTIGAGTTLVKDVEKDQVVINKISSSFRKKTQ